MTFISGTITNANPGATLYAAIETAMTSITGLTLVDTVVISTRTHKVWKSAAANNTLGKDFYIDIAYTTSGAGIIWTGAFEDYNTSTHVGIRGPLTAGGSWTPEATYYSRYGATGYALETNWTSNASITAGAAGYTSIATVSTAFGYWVSVTNNRIIIMLSNEPTAVSYAGVYTPSTIQTTASGVDVFPLVTTKVDGNGVTVAGSVAFTRYPRYNASLNLSNSATPATVAYTPVIPSGNTTTFGGFYAAPYILGMSSSAPFMLWGTLLDVRASRVDGTVSRADTVTIGSDTWYLTTGNGSSYSALFRAI